MVESFKFCRTVLLLIAVSRHGQPPMKLSLFETTQRKTPLWTAIEYRVLECRQVNTSILQSVEQCGLFENSHVRASLQEHIYRKRSRNCRAIKTRKRSSEFSKHAVDQSILHNISVAKIQEAICGPSEVIEDYQK